MNPADSIGTRSAASRLPSPLWILVPGFVLMALGLRAALVELRSAESAERERAREAAGRLARTVTGLFGEYQYVLPEPGSTMTPQEAADALRYLYPHAALDADGRSVLKDDVERFPASEHTAADLALFADALSTAETLGVGPGGDAAAALFLHGIGAAARTKGVAVAAHFAAGSREARIANRAPQGFADIHEEVARNSLGLSDEVRGQLLDFVESSLPGGEDEPSVQLRTRWDAVRETAAASMTSGAKESRLRAAPATHPILTIAAPVVFSLDSGDVPGVVGGCIPATAVADRLQPELDALAGRPGFASVHLISVDGKWACGATGAEPATDVLVETVALDAPLDDWRAEAVVARPATVPRSALALGAAVLATAAALGWGTIALRRAAHEQARAAMERQAFLDHVAHEVRTPAAALLTLGEELAAGHVAPSRRSEYEGHIVAEARRLARLVEDTLDFSRLDAGVLVFRRSPCDLRIVAQAGIEASAAQAGQVALETAAAPVVASADPTALARVVRNLVDNALRHAGGAAPIRVIVSGTATHSEIAVRDEGRGIDAAVRARLFERFHREVTATHETKGVGIGLPLSREIVRAHGGELLVSPPDSPGTTFTVRLPRAEAIDVGDHEGADTP